MSMCMDEGGIQTAHLWLANGYCLFFEGVATLGAKIVKAVFCLQWGNFAGLYNFKGLSDGQWLGMVRVKLRVNLGNAIVNKRQQRYKCEDVCAHVYVRVSESVTGKYQTILMSVEIKIHGAFLRRYCLANCGRWIIRSQALWAFHTRYSHSVLTCCLSLWEGEQTWRPVSRAQRLP